MGATKNHIFTDQQNKIATLAKALGHPARIAIIQEILAQKACICGDLSDSIQLAQPTVSQHLKELREAGIIQGSIEGRSICYCINPKTSDTIKAMINDLFQPNTKDFCC